MEQIPNFFSENPKRERIITIPTFVIRSPALPLFAGWGVSQTYFAINLWPVDSSLFFFSLFSFLFSGIVLDEPQILGTCNGCYGSRLLFPCHPNHGKVVQSLHTIDKSNTCHTSIIDSLKSHMLKKTLQV